MAYYPPVTAAEPLSRLQVSALTTALHPLPPASPCAADDDESEAEEEEEEEEAPKPKGKGKGKKAGGKQAAEEVQLGRWRYRWVGGAAGQVAVPLGGWLASGEALQLFGFGRQLGRWRYCCVVGWLVGKLGSCLGLGGRGQDGGRQVGEEEVKQGKQPRGLVVGVSPRQLLGRVQVTSLSVWPASCFHNRCSRPTSKMPAVPAHCWCCLLCSGAWH